jgi:hypothetical protein
MRRREFLSGAAMSGLVGICFGTQAEAVVASHRELLFKSRRSTAPVLPSGAVGVWYMDQFDSTNVAVPNAVSATPGIKRYNRGIRRCFTSTALWSLGGGTATEGQTDSQGGSDATRLTGGAATAMALPTNPTYPAGTKAIVVSMKSNTGATQSIRSAVTNFGTSTTHTVTTSWQRFIFTFTTTGAAATFPIAGDGTNAFDILVDEILVIDGSADPGRQTMTGHLYLGRDLTNTATIPTLASNVLDFSSGAGGLIQFDTLANLTNFTALMLFQRVAAGVNFSPILTKPGTNYQDFSLMDMINVEKPQFYLNGSGVAFSATQLNGLWDKPTSAMWHVAGNRFDGTKKEYLRDEKPVLTLVSGTAVTSPKDFFVNWALSNSFYGGTKIASIALWNRALSNAEVRSAMDVMIARAGVTLNSRVLVAEGDSLTFGNGTTSHIQTYAANANPKIAGLVYAVAGAGLNGADGTNSLYGRKSLTSNIPPAVKGSRKYILTVLIGRNDLVTGTYIGNAALYAADVATYCGLMRAAGYDKIALATCLPSTMANFNTNRNAYNAIITGAGWAAANGIDAIIDFAADATMGPDAAASNATYYSDGTHPTQAGQDLLEPIYRAVVDAL